MYKKLKIFSKWDYISSQTNINHEVVEAFQLALTEQEDVNLLNEIIKMKDNLSSLKPYKTSKSAKPAFQKILTYPDGKKLVKDLYIKYLWDFILFSYDLDGYM